MPKAPAYQSGLSRLGRSPSSRRRCCGPGQVIGLLARGVARSWRAAPGRACRQRLRLVQRLRADLADMVDPHQRAGEPALRAVQRRGGDVRCRARARRMAGARQRAQRIVGGDQKVIGGGHGRRNSLSRESRIPQRRTWFRSGLARTGTCRQRDAVPGCPYSCVSQPTRAVVGAPQRRPAAIPLDGWRADCSIPASSPTVPPMLVFVLRRLAQAVIVMLTVAFIAFMLFQYVGDPVTNILGQDATPEQRAAAARRPRPGPALPGAVRALRRQGGAGRVRPQPAPGPQGVVADRRAPAGDAGAVAARRR